VYIKKTLIDFRIISRVSKELDIIILIISYFIATIILDIIAFLIIVC